MPSLLDVRQRSLHVAASRDVPKNTSTLLASIEGVKTKGLSKDPILKKCESGYCAFDLGGSKPSDGSLKVYMVGGAVRDELLGLPVKDRDWVFTHPVRLP